jgi:hypothetical protein
LSSRNLTEFSYLRDLVLYFNGHFRVSIPCKGDAIKKEPCANHGLLRNCKARYLPENRTNAFAV